MFDGTRFAKRLEAMRQNAGLTRSQLADRAYLTRQSVWNYERGLRTPDCSVLYALCEVLNCSADALLGREDWSVK